MSFAANEQAKRLKAEDAFRAAFDRLKKGTPLRVSAGTPVSQNNVAKEAGCDPSALKKSRYPELIAEIQLWVSTRMAQEGRNMQRAKRSSRQRRSLSVQLAELRAQRDVLASLLVEADARILDLSLEVEQLKAVGEHANGPAPPGNLLHKHPWKG